jgi:rhamnose transport system ATP-binding protein
MVLEPIPRAEDQTGVVSPRLMARIDCMAEEAGVDTGMRADAENPQETIVELRGISRRFGGVHALRDVSLNLRRGEILGLLGENGAGKSTLVKILTGVLQPDEGTILVDGESRVLGSPQVAREHEGITATFQEPMVFPDLDVAENIFAGRCPTRRGIVDWPLLYRRAQDVLETMGVKLDPRTPVHELGIADRQLVEIAKALSIGARVLILDEPTAVLSSREIDILFALIKTLRDSGVALMLISHKLDEIKQLTDRVVILRDGQRVAERVTADTEVSELISLMIGREISELFPPSATRAGAEIMRVEGLTHRGYFHDVSFTLHRGEILGFAGLVGAGRTELAQALFGIDPIDTGEVWLDGVRFNPRSPRHAISCGLAYLPENRILEGLVPTMRVPLNVTMAVWNQLTGVLGYFRTAQMQRRTVDLVARVELQAGRIGQLVGTLSGGNQQKVVLAKWLAAEPRVLILDEPTHGIDIGTKPEILRIVAELARTGVGVIFISSELEEVLAMSTRVLVMREGRLVEEFESPAPRERVMEAASGVEAATVPA